MTWEPPIEGMAALRKSRAQDSLVVSDGALRQEAAPADWERAWNADLSSFEILENYGSEEAFTVAVTYADDRTTALGEAMHYAAMYGQDGPVAVYEVSRRLIFPDSPPAASGNGPERG